MGGSFTVCCPRVKSSTMYQGLSVLSLVFLLCSGTAVGNAVPQASSIEGCDYVIADIILVLDQSGSVGWENWPIQIDFVKNMVSLLPIGPYSTHIGVLTFDAENFVEFDLNTYTVESDMQAHLDKLKTGEAPTTVRLCKRTYTHAALDEALSMAQTSGRKGVPRIVVLITDGASTYPRNTEDAARRLRLSDAVDTVFAIGVGRGADVQELTMIAGSADKVKQMSFATMTDHITAIAQEACQSAEELRVPFQVQPTNRAGGTENTGKVEVQNPENQWGHVCADGFTMDDANMVCRNMGYVRAHGTGSVEAGNILLSGLNCGPDAATVMACEGFLSGGWGSVDCPSGQAAVTQCVPKCSAGTFIDAKAPTVCTPCPAGSYKPDSGEQACTSCAGGYTTTETGATGADQCVDVDECTTGAHNCDENAACANEAGTFSCACNNGWSGDGVTCVDIDVCEREGGFWSSDETCDINAICEEGVGAEFTCRCNSGYDGDGYDCDEINECEDELHDCDDNSVCENTEGSFTCNCNPGFSKNANGRTCSHTQARTRGGDDYYIVVRTTSQLFGGTDADIYLSLYGEYSSMGDTEWLLDIEGQNDFERGDTDIYIQKHMGNVLGPLTSIKLRASDVSAWMNINGENTYEDVWKAESVTICDRQNDKEYVFTGPEQCGGDGFEDGFNLMDGTIIYLQVAETRNTCSEDAQASYGHWYNSLFGK